MFGYQVVVVRNVFKESEVGYLNGFVAKPDRLDGALAVEGGVIIIAVEAFVEVFVSCLADADLVADDHIAVLSEVRLYAQILGKEFIETLILEAGAYIICNGCQFLCGEIVVSDVLFHIKSTFTICFESVGIAACLTEADFLACGICALVDESNFLSVLYCD